MDENQAQVEDEEALVAQFEEHRRRLNAIKAIASYVAQELSQELSYAGRKNHQMEREKLKLENKASCTRSLKPLLSAMKDFPSELMQRMIPVDRSIMLGMVSKEMRAAMGRVKPAARVKAKQAARAGAGQGPQSMMTSVGTSIVSARAPQTAVIEPISMLERGLGKLQEWCRVTALDLSAIKIGGEGAGLLAAVLPRCPLLAHLHLGWNRIGNEGAGLLAAVLPRCPSLAHLRLGRNNIGAEGAGLLAAVLPRCPSLAHLDLGYNHFGAEGAGRLRTAALPSLDLTV